MVFSSIPLNPVNWNDVTLEVDFQSRDVILSIGDVMLTQSFLCDDVLSTSSGQVGVVLGDEGWSCFFHDDSLYSQLTHDRVVAGGDLNGRLSQVNIWNRRLTSDDTHLLTSSCFADVYGNVMSWEDVKIGREEGAVLVFNSTCDGN